jgi:hypothetical protein
MEEQVVKADLQMATQEVTMEVVEVELSLTHQPIDQEVPAHKV